MLRIVMTTSSALLALTIVAWEWLLAPLRPGGSTLVLLALPLVWVVRCAFKADVYGLQLASMMVLLYLAEGAVRAFTESGPARLLACLEIVLSLVFFVATLAFLAPLKRAAKARSTPHD